MKADCRKNHSRLRLIKHAAVLLSLIQMLAAGCATIQQAHGNTEVQPAKATVQYENKEADYESGAVVIRAKRYTKLEKKRMETIKTHNEGTFGVLAGSIAAVFAYSISSASLLNKNIIWAPLEILGITAAAGFIVYAAAGAIYGWFNPE